MLKVSTPAAVYLLEDIWQVIHNSGQDTNQGLVEFVNRRLAHKSPTVKLKVNSHPLKHTRLPCTPPSCI